MINNTLSIKVIVGSTREGRFSDKAAAWIAGEIKKQEGLNVEVLDLRDYEMPFFNEPIPPSMKSEPYKNEAVSRFTAKIKEGDAFVIVTPEYNHGAPGILKNAIDWVSQEWNKKPVAFVGYGVVGGGRSIEQLRASVIELQMAPVQNAIYINGEQYFPVAFGKGTPEELFTKYEDKAEGMIKQLVWWAKALKNARG